MIPTNKKYTWAECSELAITTYECSKWWLQNYPDPGKERQVTNPGSCSRQDLLYCLLAANMNQLLLTHIAMKGEPDSFTDDPQKFIDTAIEIIKATSILIETISMEDYADIAKRYYTHKTGKLFENEEEKHAR